jgi:hypothetical protein
MTIPTSGLGPSNTLVTRGLGPYLVFIIRPEGPETGGSKPQFYVAPRRIWLKRKKEEPLLKLEEIEPQVIEEALEQVTEMRIDEEVYRVTGKPEPTPKQALAMLPKADLEAKLIRVKYELGVTKKEAMKILEERAKKEIEAAREFKMTLVKDDEEFILIIIMSEV